MLIERAKSNGPPATRPAAPSQPDTHALGDVARDVMDHASMILRDRVGIARLQARRYTEHLRRDVAPRAVIKATAAITGGLGLVFLLIALFLGIAAALGSVAWAFAIYGVAFILGAIFAASFAVRGVQRDEGEEIARRFPAARMEETRPVHTLVEQRSSPEAHRLETEEARREARPPP